MAKQPTNHEEGLLPPDQLVNLVAGFIKECRDRPACLVRGGNETLAMPVEQGSERGHAVH